MEKEPYFLRIDARHFYSKEEWEKMPEEAKRQAEQRTEEAYRKYKEREYKGTPEGFTTVEKEGKTIKIGVTPDGEMLEVLKDKGNGRYTTREATGEDVLFCEEVMKEGKVK